MLAVLRHRFIGTTRILVLQCHPESEFQKLAALFRARSLVGKLEKLAPETINLLAESAIGRKSMIVAVAVTPSLGMFPPPCFEMCRHRHRSAWSL
jgi:hypothetical protein